MADEFHIKNLLATVIDNAVKYSTDPIVDIRVSDESGNVTIEIEDNGCGIDLSLQRKIFDPFFTTKASGTGLGLALSQRIINAHQGDIRVASLPGCGATFTLILPIDPQENLPL